MSKSFTERSFAIVDVETTGASPVGDRVIEIGILRIEEGRVAGSFRSLVSPGTSIPASITAITGISADDLRDAPPFEDIALEVNDMLSGAVFVAHNARFDYSFVKNEFRRLGIQFGAKVLCSVRLSRKLYPKFKHHDLSSLIERHALECESRHRAYDDALAVWKFIELSRGKDPERFDAAVNDLLGSGITPQHLPHDALAKLPDCPGVYIFYGPEGETLYVGKSVSIKTRVMSHFAGDALSGKEMAMCQQVASIETRETPGELSALLLESELIKSMYPLYNRVARKRKKLVLARRVAAPGGYHGVAVEEADRIELDGYGEIVGVFKSRSQARSAIATLCSEHGLCPRLSGIEKGKGPCFGSQIGKCTGACVSRPAAGDYNAAFAEAFEGRMIRAWPFAGPVLIEERGEKATDSFIVDHWCLIGHARASEDGSVDEREMAPYFDYDNYKIIARHILNPKNRRSIKALPERALGGGVAWEIERVIE